MILLQKRHKIPGAVPAPQPGSIRIDLTELWEQTAVTAVFVAPQVLSDIQCFVEKSLERQPVHEVGGFLLGVPMPTGQRTWAISLVNFHPAEWVQSSGPTHLAFGSRVMSDLDDALLEHPDLQLAGWFHTHPNLGPYLSSSDLSIQTGFFPNPWQIAIVLDSLTENFLTGIFSYTPDGKMNNTDHLIRNQGILWRELAPPH